MATVDIGPSLTSAIEDQSIAGSASAAIMTSRLEPCCRNWCGAAGQRREARALPSSRDGDQVGGQLNKGR